MNRFIIMLAALLPLLATAQKDSISSGVYNWKEPVTKSSFGASVILFEGETNDMEWLQMSTNILPASSRRNSKYKVADNEEELIIIKSGSMAISLEDSSYTIDSGSIVLMMPGQTFSFHSGSNTPCRYYVMKYRNKSPADKERGNASGGSLVKNWNKIEFKPTDKGGRRNFLERPTTMCQRLEIHATTLKEGLKSHAPHTHQAAEFTLIAEGKTEMQIGNTIYKGEAGSIYYAPSNVLHALQNTGTGNCTYFAIQFE